MHLSKPVVVVRVISRVFLRGIFHPGLNLLLRRPYSVYLSFFDQDASLSLADVVCKTMVASCTGWLFWQQRSFSGQKKAAVDRSRSHPASGHWNFSYWNNFLVTVKTAVWLIFTAFCCWHRPWWRSSSIWVRVKRKVPARPRRRNAKRACFPIRTPSLLRLPCRALDRRLRLAKLE